MIGEAEAMMEEQYDYLTIKAEADNLKKALASWMVKNDMARADRETFSITVVRPTSLSWSVRKLTKLLPKKVLQQVTMRVVDRDALDAAVKAGDINLDKIKGALIEERKSPYIKITPKTDKGEEREEEVSAVRAAMNG